jgi:integrase
VTKATPAAQADPSAAKQGTRTASTIDELVAAYIAHVKTRKKSWDQDARILNCYVVPKWRHRPVAAITRRDVKTLVQAVGAGHDGTPAPVMMNRCIATLSILFNFAIDEEWIETSPVVRLRKLKTKEKPRDRVLSPDEIRVLWRTLDALKTAADPLIDPMICLGLQVQLCTAARPSEIFDMQLAELELGAEGEGGWFNLPAERSKNHRAHRLWLTARAVGLLRDAEARRAALKLTATAYVFAGQARGQNRAKGTTTAGGGSTSVAIRSKRALALLRTEQLLPFEVRRHDLRRTASTRMAEAGIGQATIDRVLNHASGPLQQVYNLYTYQREIQHALEIWGRQLDAILRADDATATNLLDFRPRA